MSDYARKMIEREIERALNPIGSSVHSGKVTLDISHVQYVLAERDALKTAAEKGTEYVLAHINQDLRAEIAAKNAPEIEKVNAYIRKVEAERNALLAEVERLKGVNYDLADELTVLRATKQMTAAIDAARGE